MIGACLIAKQNLIKIAHESKQPHDVLNYCLIRPHPD